MKWQIALIMRLWYQQTRKEEDFLRHAQEIVATRPGKKHIIICDLLNTHKSASLVKWVASLCCGTIDLGVKGKEGILKSQKSRMEFLEGEGHHIRFFYTPQALLMDEPD